jgi:hypothetical protein
MNKVTYVTLAHTNVKLVLELKTIVLSVMKEDKMPQLVTVHQENMKKTEPTTQNVIPVPFNV